MNDAYNDLEEPTQPEVKFDPVMVKMAMQRFRAEQNLMGGILFGLMGAFIGAGIWAVISVFTGYQIGWIAVGVGFLVGIAMRTAGKGIDKVFGISGAILALLGCLLGNLFSICYFVSSAEGIGFFEILSKLDPTMVIELMTATFNIIDILFYGIAVYEGYRISFRRITEDDLKQAIEGSGAVIKVA
jgi:hypothetical protein